MTDSTDLVPANGPLPDGRDEQRVLLEQLEAAAERAATPGEAREIMLRGQAIAALLVKARAPFEDSWKAGKASVVAARRLGLLLNDVSGAPVPLYDHQRSCARGFAPSERTLIGRDLGLGKSSANNLVRLGRVADPEFQRYIQARADIPSVSGALAACSLIRYSQSQEAKPATGWRSRRRRNHAVTTPSQPSVDTAYSELRKAAGHLGGAVARGPGAKAKRDYSSALDAVYAALDAIRPYTSGYGESSRT